MDLNRLTAPVNINPSRILAVTVAAPFWLIGAVLGLVYVVVVLLGRGFLLGFDDVRGRLL